MKNQFRIRSAYLWAAGLAVALSVGIFVERNHLLYAKDIRDSYQFFDTLVDLRLQIRQNYVEKVDDQKLLMGAINGMMGELDPYSSYFSKEDLERFGRQVHGVFNGIGTEMSQDPVTKQFIIVSPLEDSPALKAGILAGDRLVKINGEVLENLTLFELTMRLQGAPDTDVVLTVIHEGEKTPVDIKVRRGAVQLHSVKGYKRDAAGTGWDFLISPEHRIAYVRITNFMESTAEDLDKALKPLFAAPDGLRGVILDLRFNPGGLLQAGVDVSDRFMEGGTIVSTRKPGGPDEYKAEAKKEGTYPNVPLVVLVNEYSASASEIVAGALKDHGRALLIGTRTFGKGSVQNLITLDRGEAALKLTTHYYYLPSGRNIARRKDAKVWGVEPDPVFQLPMTDAENRALLQARARSEIIRVKAPVTPPVAGGANTQPATRPATAPATGPATGPATVPASAPAPLGNGSAATASRPAEEMDKQLARALETLVANQVFNKEKPVTVSVSTTRPGATVEAGPVPAVPPADTLPAETRPVETKPAETKPAETKPVDTRPAETKPVESRPVETKPALPATRVRPQTAPKVPADTAPKPEAPKPDLKIEPKPPVPQTTPAPETKVLPEGKTSPDAPTTRKTPEPAEEPKVGVPE